MLRLSPRHELTDRCIIKRQTGTTMSASRNVQRVLTDIALDVPCLFVPRSAEVRRMNAGETKSAEWFVIFERTTDIRHGDVITSTHGTFRATFVALRGRNHFEVDVETHV